MRCVRVDEMGDTRSTSERPTILIIEGEEVYKEIHTLMLADLGYQLIGCTDPQKAVRLAETERPDVIIIDPLNSVWGVDVCWELQTHPATSTIPFICATYLPCAGYDVVLAELEFARIIGKPFAQDKLREALRSVLEAPAGSMPREKFRMIPHASGNVSLRIEVLRPRHKEVVARDRLRRLIRRNSKKKTDLS
jgi:DNA-binding response OmpR family regulator